jgi:hypothetical protein
VLPVGTDHVLWCAGFGQGCCKLTLSIASGPDPFFQTVRPVVLIPHCQCGLDGCRCLGCTWCGGSWDLGT